MRKRRWARWAEASARAVSPGAVRGVARRMPTERVIGRMDRMVSVVARAAPFHAESRRWVIEFQSGLPLWTEKSERSK